MQPAKRDDTVPSVRHSPLLTVHIALIGQHENIRGGGGSHNCNRRVSYDGARRDGQSVAYSNWHVYKNHMEQGRAWIAALSRGPGESRRVAADIL